MPLTALVVDDNHIMRQVEVSLLRRLGIAAISVCDGVEAVTANNTSGFPVILMDIEMPRMNGLAATMLIRRHEHTLSQHSLIIAVTAAADRQDCFAAGMNDYIQKPLTLGNLQESLRTWGWQPINSIVEMQQVLEALRLRGELLRLQVKKLGEENTRFEEFKRDLDRTPHSPEGDQKLHQWQDSLETRQWAITAAVQFLNRRQESIRLETRERFGDNLAY